MRIGAYVLALFVLLCGMGVARAGSLVIVESNCPSLPAGQVIDDAAPLRLPPGAQVVLIAESGATLTLSGPFSGAPAATGGGAPSDPSLVSALSNLLQTSGTQTSSLGAMKEVRLSDAPMAQSAPTPQDPWVLDTANAATYCVPAGGAAALWRADDGNSAVLRLEAEVSGQRADVTWPAGRSVLPWPASLPPMDGSGYLVSVEKDGGALGSGGVVMMGAGNGKRVVVRFVPADLPTEAHRIVWMARSGCEAQARRLLATLR